MALQGLLNAFSQTLKYLQKTFKGLRQVQIWLEAMELDISDVDLLFEPTSASPSNGSRSFFFLTHENLNISDALYEKRSEDFTLTPKRAESPLDKRDHPCVGSDE